MAPHIQGIDHLHLYVSDRRAARAWYAETLGFQVVPELEHWAEGGGPLTLADASGAVHLALFERPAATNRSTIAFATTAEQFIAWQGHLRHHVDPSIVHVDHGAAWSMYFSDPDGNPYEITCYAVDELRRLAASRG